MINILINNIRFVNPTSLIRALKKLDRQDIVIWGTDCEPSGFIPSSTFVDHYIVAPSMDYESEYYDFIQKLCKANRIDFIIPGSDKDVQFYGKNRTSIEPKIVLPEDRAINLFVDKYESTLQLKSLGFSTPPLVNDLFSETKIIFRKKISSSSEGIITVDLTTAEQLPNLFNNSYFVQRYIEGEEYTVDIFADYEGHPTLVIPRKRIKIKNGMSVCCQLCYHKKIIDICQNLYSLFFLPGLTNVQFIDDGHDVYFIEMNMRFAGSGICGIAASFNYLELYLEHFLNGKTLMPFDYYMDKVAWGSIISRYYDESVFSSSVLESSKS